MITLRDVYRSLIATPLVPAVAVVSLAGWLPARGASRIDPVAALRQG